MVQQQQQEQPPVLRLASASPRRRQLLDLIGVPHVVTPADIDETPLPAEAGTDYVMRLARDKALAAHARHGDLPVLAADTTVHVDGHILEKPQSEADCLRMLGLLSGLGNADDLIGVAPIIGVGITGTLASLANAAGLGGTPVLNGRIYTFSGTPSVNIDYTGQAVGPVTLGATDTVYRVNWTVGGY